MNVFDRQRLQGLIKFAPAVPMSALIGTLAATSALVEPQQAVPVKQAKHEAPPRDSHDLCNRARPVVYEAQCRDRNDLVEGLVGQRQTTSIPCHVGYILIRSLAGEIERVGIDVHAGHVEVCGSKATGDPAATATHVEQACARPHIEVAT